MSSAPPVIVTQRAFETRSRGQVKSDGTAGQLTGTGGMKAYSTAEDSEDS